MKPYAVIQTGGKQYLVHHNEVISVEKLEGERSYPTSIKNGRDTNGNRVTGRSKRA